MGEIYKESRMYIILHVKGDMYRKKKICATRKISKK